MKELVAFLVRQFVPDENFEIVVIEDEETVDFRVLVDKDFIAKLIGKAGRTSKAIRTIVREAAGRSDKSYSVYIEER